MAPSKQRSGGNARPLESWTRAWFVGETRRPMTRPDPGTNTSTSSGKQPAPGRRRNAGERCAGAGGTTPRGVVSGGGPRSRLAAALDSRRPLHRPREVCRRDGSSSPGPARTRRPARASLSPPPRGGGRPAARRAAGLPRGRLPSAPQGRGRVRREAEGGHRKVARWSEWSRCRGPAFSPGLPVWSSRPPSVPRASGVRSRGPVRAGKSLPRAQPHGFGLARYGLRVASHADGDGTHARAAWSPERVHPAAVPAWPRSCRDDAGRRT
jgi:hypothetical protein